MALRQLIDAGNSTRYPVDGTIVIGADPGRDPEVVTGAASMIVVDDPGVDEVQVRIRMSGHGVAVENVAGGQVSIQVAGGTRRPLGSSEELTDGTQLQIGGRTFLYRVAPPPGA